MKKTVVTITASLAFLLMPTVLSAGSVNLALNRTATASYVYGGENIDGGCCGAFWGNDGDPGTHWSAQWAPAWWQVDLGSLQPVSQIFYAGASNSFTLLVDGTEITSGGTTRDHNTWTYDFATPIDAQVIRLDFTGGSDWAVVYEMAAYGPGNETSGVPEPASWNLVAAGLIALGLSVRSGIRGRRP